MIYTLCWEDENILQDIKVNREQKIKETLAILSDGGILPEEAAGDITITSKRNNCNIDSNMSYIQAEIYNGDILYIR